MPGQAKATQEVDLSFEVSGKVLERAVFVGDTVDASQVVARLDDRDYRNDLAKAEAEEERAQAQLDRIEQAAQTGAVSQQDVTNARADINLAKAEVRIAQKALDDTVITAPFDMARPHSGSPLKI